MPEATPNPAGSPADELSHTLRQLGSRAHQLRASTRAADHFNASDAQDDRSTGSWLMSSAVVLAHDLATDLDVLARSLRERGADAAMGQTVGAVRTRAHQVHAAARAADHFLDQDSNEDRETGSWMIAAAHGLATKLASEIDDGAAPQRRPAIDKASIEAHDAGLARRMAAATKPLRGAA